jgi:DMSO/TMAO reductase YedYZ molybdopterin-dependent catalytic subunit
VNIVQAAKDHPVGMLLGSSGSIIALVTALFTLDARYAHAAEVQNDKAQVQQLIKETSKTLRKQMLEDKLFEIEIKIEQTRAERRPVSPIDSALKERYKRQIDDLVKTP